MISELYLGLSFLKIDKNSEGLIQKTRIQVTDKPGKAKSQEQLLHKTQHLKLNKHELHKKPGVNPGALEV